ncbi:MAG: hypothetical protein C5B54_10230 [Acidobacteria bacterium]|nr:MAG: hypothetical protein C5B54_10230 [Acidobacteriota bacterium]
MQKPNAQLLFMLLNIETLKEFAKRGASAQEAVNAILSKARGCPYCGKRFLPQTANHKYCSYTCREDSRAEKLHWRRHGKIKEGKTCQ